MIFGSVKQVAQIQDDPSRRRPAGFTSVLVPNPSTYMDDQNPERIRWELAHGPLPAREDYPEVWINVYTTRNNRGVISDLRYCEIEKTVEVRVGLPQQCPITAR